ncbi:3-hydroxyanthranilate 3,4-dioxygenase [Neisseriaceae bacterium CLB008]
MELKYGKPLNLLNWSAENKHRLSPPVCNAAVFPDGDYFINMVGGPNFRTDFHCNPTEEIFYQIKGTAYLNLWENGQFDQVLLKEGDVFLLPAGVLHSPQRPDPEGLCFLVEKPRPKDQEDKLNWFCANCAGLVFSIGGQVDDLVANLPIWYQSFYERSEAERTCPHCQEVHPGQNAKAWLQRFAEVHKPAYK